VKINATLAAKPPICSHKGASFWHAVGFFNAPRLTQKTSQRSLAFFIWWVEFTCQSLIGYWVALAICQEGLVIMLFTLAAAQSCYSHV
jgi:hypothetical protein